jgi:hypothetical protein
MRRGRKRHDLSDIRSITDTGCWWAQSAQAARAGGLCAVETICAASGVGTSTWGAADLYGVGEKKERGVVECGVHKRPDHVALPSLTSPHPTVTDDTATSTLDTPNHPYFPSIPDHTFIPGSVI